MIAGAALVLALAGPAPASAEELDAAWAVGGCALCHQVPGQAPASPLTRLSWLLRMSSA